MKSQYIRSEKRTLIQQLLTINRLYTYASRGRCGFHFAQPYRPHLSTHDHLLPLASSVGTSSIGSFCFKQERVLFVNSVYEPGFQSRTRTRLWWSVDKPNLQHLNVVPSLPAEQGLSSDAVEAAGRLRQFITNTAADERDLTSFYSLSFSPTRVQKLGEYFSERQNEVYIEQRQKES